MSFLLHYFLFQHVIIINIPYKSPISIELPDYKTSKELHRLIEYVVSRSWKFFLNVENSPEPAELK